jgi:Phosphodiester glycosidase
VGLLAAGLAGCGTEAPAAGSSGAASSVPVPPQAISTAAARAPDLVPERGRAGEHDLIVFRASLTRARLTIADVGMSTDLAGVLAKVGGSLAVNGGFFEVDTTPEGLAVSEGRELSAKSLVLGGGVAAIAAGRASLFAVEDYSPPPGLDFAVQCRPRLVVSGAQHVKRDDGREAERTALCLREGGSVVEVVVARGEGRGSGPTLSAWSALLAARGCEGALNLDGGPSTGAAWVEDGAIRSVPPREGIRHAIVVTLR